ncbi:MAG: lysophospholipase [Spirochaetia bacterium]
MIEATGAIPAGGNRPQIFFRRWAPEGRTPPAGPRPVLAVCHGYGEHSGRYTELARYFTGLGFSVYALDLRGHGKSGGERAFVRRFAVYAEDLEVFLAEVRAESGSPIVLIGHSMGGAVSLIYAGKYGKSGNRLEGLILSGPALRLAVKVGAVRRVLVNILAGIAPRMKAAPGVADLISRDPAVVAEFKNDPLTYSGPTKAGMARTFIRAEEEVTPFLSEIELPLLVMQGSEDKIIDTASGRIASEMVNSRDTTLKYYEGLYHVIFHEPEREEVFADMARWLEERDFTNTPGGKEGSDTGAGG